MRTDIHEQIIVEALQDYRKRFEDDPDRQQVIDLAINSLIQDREFFPITSVCKDDIFHAFGDDKEAKKAIEKMDEGDMETLASKLADDYCDQLYWDSLKIIVELTFM